MEMPSTRQGICGSTRRRRTAASGSRSRGAASPVGRQGDRRALPGRDVVGVSTGVPLLDGDADFRTPFEQSKYDLADVFSFGESVLEKAYRGMGAGHRFFDEREAFAERLGYGVTTFCAVVRPDDHPHRPIGYRPLDDFWRKRGYVRQPQMVARYGWKEIGQEEETDQEMVFWVREKVER